MHRCGGSTGRGRFVGMRELRPSWPWPCVPAMPSPAGVLSPASGCQHRFGGEGKGHGEGEQGAPCCYRPVESIPLPGPRKFKACALRGWVPLVACPAAGGDCEKQCLSNGGARRRGSPQARLAMLTKWSRPTRLETRTKESNMYASTKVT
jgi:hypothetical protein